jgi:hypothetical protein
MKIRRVGAELFLADRKTDGRTADSQTDMTKLKPLLAILRTHLKTIKTIEVSGNIFNITKLRILHQLKTSIPYKNIINVFTIY